MLMKLIRFPALFLGAAFLLLACTGGEEEAPRSLLKEKDRDFFQSVASSFTGSARLVLFTSDQGCEYCDLTRSFLTDLAALSEKVSLQVLDLEEAADQAARFGVDKTPATVILGSRDYGLRYYGLPTGYEFTAFVEAIHKAAEGVHGLDAATAEGLAALARPVMVTVFSTKT
jgi:alkyl hydroperoxide reductase subunit AhpF